MSYLSTSAKLAMLGVIAAGIGLRLWPVIVHQGLPGGDSYMAILWLRIIERDHGIPAYAEISSLWLSTTSLTGLNITYLTPFLHSFLFGLASLTGVSDFDIILVVVVSIWAAILFLMFRMVDRLSRFEALAVIAVLSILGVKTLRYFFQTGFHFQNLVGDLLVIMLMFLALRVMEREGVSRVKAYLILLAVGPATVFLFHQLSGILSFVTLLLFLPIVLLSTPLPEDAVFRRRVGVLLAAVILGLAALLLFLVLSVPLIADVAQNLVTVSPEVALILGPWSRYAEFLGPAVWTLGVGGALVALATLIGGYIFRLKGLKGFQIPRARHHLLLLGLTWLAATLLLSRSQDLGLNLPGLRFLWYASYPLALLAVIGVMSIRYFNPGPNGSKARLIKPLFQVGLAMLIVVSGLLTIPQATNAVNVGPPGVNSYDSTYNGEVATVVSFLRSSISADSAIWIDFVGWRSLIWLWPELTPSHNVSVRVLPGSAFNHPIEQEALDRFYASPPGSIVVKSLTTRYGYIADHDNFTFITVATTPHLLILEKVMLRDPPWERPSVDLTPQPVTTPSPELLLVIPVMIIPGIFAGASLRTLRKPPSPNRLWLSIPKSVLLIGIAFAGALLLGLSSVWFGLAFLALGLGGLSGLKFVLERPS